MKENGDNQHRVSGYTSLIKIPENLSGYHLFPVSSGRTEGVLLLLYATETLHSEISLNQ